MPDKPGVPRRAHHPPRCFPTSQVRGRRCTGREGCTGLGEPRQPYAWLFRATTCWGPWLANSPTGKRMKMSPSHPGPHSRDMGTPHPTPRRLSLRGARVLQAPVLCRGSSVAPSPLWRASTWPRANQARDAHKLKSAHGKNITTHSVSPSGRRLHEWALGETAEPGWHRRPRRAARSPRPRLQPAGFREKKG